MLGVLILVIAKKTIAANGINIFVKALPSIEPNDNIWSQAATLSSAIVAIFTGFLAWSTRSLSIKTSELAQEQHETIIAEEKRYQQGYAPLIRPGEFVIRGNTIHMQIENIGIGIAKNIVFNIVLDWHGADVPSIAGVSVTKQMSFIPTPPYDLSRIAIPLVDFPNGYNRFLTKKLLFQYEDMFGNTYQTISNNPQSENLQWITPDNLKRS